MNLSGTALHQGCVADDLRRHPHRPTPDPATGALDIDPEIELKARGFGLNISFHYNTNGATNAEYGKKRSASVAGHLVSGTSGAVVTVVRGDGAELPFMWVGGALQPPTNLPVQTSLTYAAGQYTEHFADGMKLVYATITSGSVTYPLARAEDAYGNRHTYSYSGGLLEAIEAPGGRKATFTYSAGSPTSLLTGIQDWSGRRWTFGYDADRQLTTLTTPTGCTTKYTYAAAPNGVTMVSSIEDPRGYRTSYLYDSQGRVISMAAGTAEWTWSFTAGSKTVMTSPAGARTTYSYDGSGNLTSVAHP